MNTAQIYIGDNPWSNGNLVLTSSFVTSVIVGSATNVSYLRLTHPALAYGYHVYAQLYSNDNSSASNDGNLQQQWIYKFSATETRIMLEYNSAESTT